MAGCFLNSHPSIGFISLLTPLVPYSYVSGGWGDSNGGVSCLSRGADGAARSDSLRAPPVQALFGGLLATRGLLPGELNVELRRYLLM